MSIRYRRISLDNLRATLVNIISRALAVILCDQWYHDNLLLSLQSPCVSDLSVLLFSCFFF